MKWTLILFLSLGSLFCKSGISYDFSGGRFGDNLLSYIHARWISYSKALPFIYKPFPYSSSLKLHRFDPPYRYKQEIKLHLQEPIPPLKISQLLICPYFAEEDLENVKNRDFFQVDWKDLEFRCLISQLIAPTRSIAVIRPTLQQVNVALHFREGGGFDDTAFHQIQPKKFPPFDFYKQSLLHLLNTFPHSPIHCHIFTDALFPQQFAQQLQEDFRFHPHLTFSYRKENNRPDQNVLEDFFSLFNFDVLIRPESNFSLIPSLIQDFAMVYSPGEFRGPIPHLIRVQTHPPSLHQLAQRVNSDLFELECGSDRAQSILLLP